MMMIGSGVFYLPGGQFETTGNQTDLVGFG